MLKTLLLYPASFQILKIFLGLSTRIPFVGTHPTPTFSDACPALHSVLPIASVSIVPTLRNDRWFMQVAYDVKGVILAFQPLYVTVKLRLSNTSEW